MDGKRAFKRNKSNVSNSDTDENEYDDVGKIQPSVKRNKCLPKLDVTGYTTEIGSRMNKITKQIDHLENFFDEDDDFFENALNEAEQYTLDLSTWKRCKIISVLHEARCMILTVEEKSSGAKAKCCIEPPWTTLHIQEGDVVSLSGHFDTSSNLYKITSNGGMLVTDPDHLVSGTSVVGALYCQRRGVLQERFRGIDSDNKIMTVGTIIHELLQKILRDQLTSIDDIKMLGKKYVNSKEIAHMLYACEMSQADASKELEQFYPKIFDFLRKHVSYNQTSSNSKSDLQINTIKDIEENVWCHQLGLKGKIDVTVKARCSPQEQFQLMPLELKTGRASFSAEHKGQIVLYEMMMNLVGHHVEKGILLYLREGKCAPVLSNRNMKRDLIMLRNEVAYYLSKGLPNITSDSFNISKDILPLPEPLNNRHVCSRCPYSVLCTAYLKREERNLSDDHAIKLIADESLSHLTDKHIDYFIHWAGLIFLEHEESRRNFKLKHLWTKTPEVRMEMKRAVTNLKLTGRVIRIGDEYFHTFQQNFDHRDASNHDVSSFFEVDEYLICSTSKRIAVAAGRVIAIGKQDVTMCLERDLSHTFSMDEQFILDKYESQTSMTFNLTNIGVLLDNTERSDILRRIIVDKEKPTFTRSVSSLVTATAKDILKDLNKHQKIAILTAIGTKSYCLFKGLPGTGKTQTVIALIRLLVAMDNSVLITSNTHSAVDNILKRLMFHNVRFIRLGNVSRIDPAIKQFSEQTLTENCTTPEELTAIYNSFKIVGVTCLGSSHAMFTQRTFDFCVVDEATQVFQCAVIRPLLLSNRFILIGDPDQLPPVVKSRKAKAFGADESLFLRLDKDASCCVLPAQYRMNKTITKLANDFSYKGKLICANESVASSFLKLPNIRNVQEKHKTEKWLLRAIASQLELGVVLINTQNTFKSSVTYGESTKWGRAETKIDAAALYKNYCEAAVVFYIAMTLLESGIEGEAIGVIAPFKAQVELLSYYLGQLKKFYKKTRDQFEPKNLDIEVNTVDQYQGKDKDVIIYTCTKTLNPDVPAKDSSEGIEYEILEDCRRLTVAITRAKKKLIIIGDTQCLERYTPFRELFKHIAKVGRITLQQNSFGFEWNDVLGTLDMLEDCDE
ncbi:DNA replication ATP-dependent helicase/nuclease DNA2-like [Toxorhynchites rutilus septentrionalis]|uniref:DNA replication ATP-dependent helicase/nuclease DNA2-like n=1 Tax=Toxorhynchites rutilus septentrionalis TaxID=329112 RepID=UPI002479103A|nr:DNA replication ATP-dependent helicase/nuclease DNA2-like [Toxorhynchites rutilus septentrionalis]